MKNKIQPFSTGKKADIRSPLSTRKTVLEVIGPALTLTQNQVQACWIVLKKLKKRVGEVDLPRLSLLPEGKWDQHVRR